MNQPLKMMHLIILYTLIIFQWVDSKTIVLTSSGDYGHVKPLLCLALQLQQENHSVMIVTHSNMLPFIPPSIQFVNAGEKPIDVQMGKTGSFLFSVNTVVKNVVATSKEVYFILASLPKKPDLIVTDVMEFGGRLFAKQHKIKHAINNPSFHYDPVHDPWFAPLPFGGLSIEPSFVASVLNGAERLAFNFFSRLILGTALHFTLDDSNSFVETVHNLYQADIILSNTYVGFDWARLTSPNVFYTGTLFHKDVESPLNITLPANKKIIYISFGTIGYLSEIQEKTLFDYISCFLNDNPNFHIVWKTQQRYQHAQITEVQWISQKQLLLDNRVELFISHGGSTGVMESIDAKKPVIVIPLFAEQFKVCQLIEKMRIGACSDLSTLGSLLSNYSSFRENVEFHYRIEKQGGGVEKAANLLTILMDGDWYIQLIPIEDLVSPFIYYTPFVWIALLFYYIVVIVKNILLFYH